MMPADIELGEVLRLIPRVEVTRRLSKPHYIPIRKFWVSLDIPQQLPNFEYAICFEHSAKLPPQKIVYFQHKSLSKYSKPMQ